MHYGIYVKTAVLAGVVWAGYRRPQSLPWYVGGMVGNLLCFEPFIALTLTLGAAVNLLRYHRPLRWPFNSVPLGVLFGVAVLSSARTWPVGDSIGPLLTWLAIGLFYWVLANGMAVGGLAPVRAGLVGGTLATVFAALWEYRRGDYASTGANWHQNAFAMVINALFPILWLGSLDGEFEAVSSTPQVLWAGTCLGAAVPLTLSRTGLGLSAVQLGLCGLLTLRADVPPPGRQRALLMLSLEFGRVKSIVYLTSHSPAVPHTCIGSWRQPWSGAPS